MQNFQRAPGVTTKTQKFFSTPWQQEWNLSGFFHFRLWVFAIILCGQKKVDLFFLCLALPMRSGPYSLSLTSVLVALPALVHLMPLHSLSLDRAQVMRLSIFAHLKYEYIKII